MAGEPHEADQVRGLPELIARMGGISGEPDLRPALCRVVELAAARFGARYGALGVMTDGVLAPVLIAGPRPDPEPTVHAMLTVVGRGDVTVAPLSVLVTDNERLLGALYLAERLDGRPYDSSARVMLNLYAAAAAVAITNARRYERIREQELWLGAHYALTNSLLAGTSPDSQLADVIGTARRLTDADYAVLFHVDDARETLTVRVADGVASESTIGTVLPLDESLAGVVFGSGEPMVVSNLYANTSRAPWLSDWLPPLGPAALVPLGVADRALGVVVVTRLQGRPPFPTEALAMLRSFAIQASVALHLARERRWREQVSLYADRERIAHDLHDVVIQRLFATGMSLTGAVRKVTEDEVRGRLQRAVVDLDETVRQIRATIYQLQRPAEPGDDPRAAILSVTDQATDALGFSPVVGYTQVGRAQVPMALRRHLTAVIRELLTNVARHASATRVDVDFRVDERAITVRVVDDGVGLRPAGRRSGLRNLAERARLLGGTMTAEVGAGGGTIVVWRVPLTPR